MIRVAINGFGRIGRAFLRAAVHDPGLEVVAINDLGDLENLAYLLRHDSVYREFAGQVSVKDGSLVIGVKPIKVLQEKDPTKLPWGQLGIDVVVESTGFFTDFTKAQVHIAAGAKRVVISAPASGAEAGGATVLVGVNEERLQTCQVTSNASCTTNASSPVIAILDETLGIEKALLNTVHAYTASQRLVDSPNAKDFREGRAAAQNIVPTSTGAAIAVTKAYPALAGAFDGIALRVPVVAGSIADITFVAKRDTSVEEVNRMLEAAAATERWRGIFAVTHEPLVSSDIIGDEHASIADLAMTRVVGGPSNKLGTGNLVKVLAWYDNEAGYTQTLLRHVKKAGAVQP